MWRIGIPSAYLATESNYTSYSDWFKHCLCGYVKSLTLWLWGFFFIIIIVVKPVKHTNTLSKSNCMWKVRHTGRHHVDLRRMAFHSAAHTSQVDYLQIRPQGNKQGRIRANLDLFEDRSLQVPFQFILTNMQEWWIRLPTCFTWERVKHPGFLPFHWWHAIDPNITLMQNCWLSRPGCSKSEQIFPTYTHGPMWKSVNTCVQHLHYITE